MSKGVISAIIVGVTLTLVGMGVSIYFVVTPVDSTIVEETGLPLTPDGDIDLDALDLEQPAFTPHNSVIIDDVDEALVGTWRLQSQAVVGQTNPFSGHLLTIGADGSMVHDYSSETASAAPDCTVGGSVPARFTTTLGADFDAIEEGADPDSTTATYSELRVTRLSATNPTVACEGADITVESNSPVQPLGTGPSTTAAGDTFVAYTYTLDPDWSVLTVVLGNPSTTYVYSRVN